MEMDYDLRYMHKLHKKTLDQCFAFVPAGKGKERGGIFGGGEWALLAILSIFFFF